MIYRPSADEKVQAILDTVQPVAKYLQAIGKIEAFNDFTKDEICGLIRTAQQGVQDSLRNQCSVAFADNGLDDREIPF